MPNKTFSFDTLKRTHAALELPEGLTAQAALEQVLRLPSVCSKRFLTTKVDRHVTGEFLRGFGFTTRARAPPAPPAPPPPRLFSLACDDYTFPC